MNSINFSMKISKKTRQRGFTLLIAALVASVALSLASAIFSIAQKQVTLASLSQQSQYAFYTADTAAECALYWDIRYSYFGLVTPIVPSPPLPPQCDGQPLTVSGAHATYPYTLSFQFGPNGKCANVTVQKCQGQISGKGVCCAGFYSSGVCNLQAGEPISTQIRADGFNVACAAVSSSQIALERSVVLNY